MVRSGSGPGGAFQYSRRVLRLWRRGAYSPVLTHGLRVASLRSGGCRLAVRETIECHLCAQLRTPFPASRDFPSRGNEKIGGTGYCVTYDTDSQSRNADFISIARRAIRNPQRRRRCRPLSGSELQPFYTTRGASRAPFSKICPIAIPQPSARRAVKLKNLTNPRGKAPLTLAPEARPFD